MASGSMIPTGWPTPVRLLPPTAPVVDGDGSVTADFWLNQQTHIITFTLLAVALTLLATGFCAFLSIQRARKRCAQTAAAAKQVQPNEEIESRLTPPRRSKKSRRETKRKPFQLRVAVSTTKTTRMGWDDLGKTESGMYRTRSNSSDMTLHQDHNTTYKASKHGNQKAESGNDSDDEGNDNHISFKRAPSTISHASTVIVGVEEPRKPEPAIPRRR